MKKLSIVLVSLTLMLAIFAGCTKDTTTPTISLTGSSVTMDLGGVYTDPGYTATDATDGTIPSANIVVTGLPNVDQVGEYSVKYNVKNKAGVAAAEVSRTVYVQSTKLAGTYDVDEVVTGKNAGNYTYTVTVTQSSSDYSKLLVSNFGGFGATVSVYMTVSGAVISIPSQNPTSMPDPGVISGNGSYNKSGAIYKITSLNYSAVYTSGGTDNATATYTKQ
jgi:hypothetical protein